MESLTSWMDAAVAALGRLAESIGLPGCLVAEALDEIPNGEGAYVSLYGRDHVYLVGVGGNSSQCQLLARSLLGMQTSEPDLDPDSVADAVGEVANVVAGNVKATLAAVEPGLLTGLPLFAHGRLRVPSQAAVSRRVLLGSLEAFLVIQQQAVSTEMQERRRLDLALQKAHTELLHNAETLQCIFSALPDALLVLSQDGLIETANAAAQHLLGYTGAELEGRPAVGLFEDGRLDLGAVDLAPLRVERRCLAKDSSPIPVLCSSASMRGGDTPRFVVALLDLRDRKRLEMRLLQARKLESVGRLAAGVAHEINTPLQFISDNLIFVRETLPGVLGLMQEYRSRRRALAEVAASTLDADRLERAEAEIDLDFAIEEMPNALDTCQQGLDQVTRIVRSMKSFAHPGSSEMGAVDINQAIVDTLAVARNEYNDVAEVEANLGDLPVITAHGGELNQVFLNMIVNAAHAIRGATAETGSKGKITINTSCEGDWAVVTIADTGGGIPADIRDRVFDPFFTTKAVGEGTGQGLSIAHNVVRDRHQGSIGFETEVGKGTTFFIRLPLTRATGHPGA